MGKTRLHVFSLRSWEVGSFYHTSNQVEAGEKILDMCTKMYNLHSLFVHVSEYTVQ